jgi:hypothetical protein
MTLLTTAAEPTGDAATSGTDGGAASAAPAAAPVTEAQPSGTGEGQAAAADGQGAATGEAAPAGGASAAAAAGGAEEEAGAAAGAPEAYEAFALPEGYSIPEELNTALTATAKELKLPQAAAQKVVDLAVQHAQRMQAAMDENLTAARTEWEASARADQEIGGANLTANLAIAKKGLTTFGSPALIELLNGSGLGNHPEIIRAFYRVGKTISEDTIVSGDAGGAAVVKDTAKKLYPGMT